MLSEDNKEISKMEYVIRKNGKYLQGHGSIGLRYKFHWTDDLTKARRFAADDSNSDYFASITRGAIIGVPAII